MQWQHTSPHPVQRAVMGTMGTSLIELMTITLMGTMTTQPHLTMGRVPRSASFAVHLSINLASLHIASSQAVRVLLLSSHQLLQVGPWPFDCSVCSVCVLWMGSCSCKCLSNIGRPLFTI
mmetsp:Transcript_135963/g.434038  ORF Transcript_135963/g.434038 Transcript_135963/m.434038 type:complete len:120 (+) Transcript_135963:119-478(+)